MVEMGVRRTPLEMERMSGPSEKMDGPENVSPEKTSAVSEPAPGESDFQKRFVLKEKIEESTGYECWGAYDRTQKKRMVVKRYQDAFFPTQEQTHRFFEDAQALIEFGQAHRQASMLKVMAFGQDDQWYWVARESAGTNKSLRQWSDSGKMMLPREAVKRFGILCDILELAHREGIIHRCVKPENIYLIGSDSLKIADFDIGHFYDPAESPEMLQKEGFLEDPFLAPEQRSIETEAGSRTDIWQVGASIAYALTHQPPTELNWDRVHKEIRHVLQKALSDDPSSRFDSMETFHQTLEEAMKAARKQLLASQTSTASNASNNPTPPPKPSPAANQSAVSAEKKEMFTCPHCNAPGHLAAKFCKKCGLHYEEPCLACQYMNLANAKFCSRCRKDLQAMKAEVNEKLKAQQVQIMKFREGFAHDRAIQMLKQMIRMNHPAFGNFRTWAKGNLSSLQKEWKDLRNFVERMRIESKQALEEQKYEKVQQILEKIPPALMDDELRKRYMAAGECVTEVDSLIREIRNAIAAKQYNTLLSTVQRYLELKANDPEAKSLQQKIEKYTTVTSPVGMKFRLIPDGKFYMGSHDSDDFIRNNERPQHRVHITNSFYMGVYPVTQDEFIALMDTNPSTANDNSLCPVDTVNWYQACDFCNKLSEQEGLPYYYELTKVKRKSNQLIETAEVKILGGEGYRLPTEAEWEYACRAGSITPWCYGDLSIELGQYAWYFDNIQLETQPVGHKKPNSWGLYDMHGNVMEWCNDWYNELYYQQNPPEEDPQGPDTGTAKVLRGGAWQFGAEAARSPCRNSSNPESASNIVGFRVARTAPPDAIESKTSTM